MLGWHIHNARITQWLMDKHPMAYNTAISLVAVGAALLLVSLGRRRLAAVLCIVGGLPSLLTLFEYVSGKSLGIDQLLMKSGSSSVYAGRIAPNTVLCLLLLSAAVLCMTKEFRWRTFASSLLASVAWGIGAVSVIGYLTGFATFGWGRLIPIAVPTSVGLTLLSLAALGYNWRDRELSGGGAPPWLFIAVTLAAMLMTVSLWQVLASEEHARIERTVGSQLEIVRLGLVKDLDSRIAAVARFSRRWEQTGPPDPKQWEFEAGLLVKDVQSFQAIGWVGPAFRVHWVYPRERNEAVLGADLSHDRERRRALETARDLRRTILTRPIPLFAGGTGIDAYVPIYRGSVFQGFIIADFRFQDVFRQVAESTLAPGYAIAIYDGDERIFFQAPQDQQLDQVWARQAVLQVENSRWILKLWPTRSALAALESTALNIVLPAGLLLSVLLGLAVYLAQAARLKSRLAEQARRELEKEMAERQRAEQELEEFFEVSPDMLCIAGFDGYFKRLNPAWASALGWPIQHLLEQPFVNFVHPDDVDATQDVVEQQRAGTNVLWFENRYRAQDGSYHWMQWIARPHLERHLIYAAARDVTAEKARAEELHRFAAIVQSSDDAIFSKSLDGVINTWNKGAERLYGYTAFEAVGQPLTLIVPPELHQEVHLLLRRILQGESVVHHETVRLRKDGGRVDVSVTLSAVRDLRGEISGASAIARDITERKRVEEQLNELNASLERRVLQRTADLAAVNQELEAFNYSVSHDLRAPLRHIDGYSKMLLEDHGAGLSDDARRCVDRIRSGAQRMGRMVDELLELSRTSRSQPSKQLTGLRSLVADVVES